MKKMSILGFGAVALLTASCATQYSASPELAERLSRNGEALQKTPETLQQALEKETGSTVTCNAAQQEYEVKRFDEKPSTFIITAQQTGNTKQTITITDSAAGITTVTEDGTAFAALEQTNYDTMVKAAVAVAEFRDETFILPEPEILATQQEQTLATLQGLLTCLEAKR